MKRFALSALSLALAAGFAHAAEGTPAAEVRHLHDAAKAAIGFRDVMFAPNDSAGSPGGTCQIKSGMAAR